MSGEKERRKEQIKEKENEREREKEASLFRQPLETVIDDHSPVPSPNGKQSMVSGAPTSPLFILFFCAIIHFYVCFLVFSICFCAFCIFYLSELFCFWCEVQRAAVYNL